jgi:hypothetical protein
MNADDMVDAAIAGFEQGGLITTGRPMSSAAEHDTETVA